MLRASELVVSTTLFKTTNHCTATEQWTRPPTTPTSSMDHYHKISSQLIENALLPNEIRVSSSGRHTHLIDRAISIMNAHPVDGVVISSCGSHVTKAVGVVEQIQKQNPDILQKSFDLLYLRVEDMWAPDLPGLDILKVTRNIPALQVRLVKDSTTKQNVQSNGRRKRRSQDTQL